MELIRYDSAASRLIAKSLTDDFRLLDLGCAGGIDQGWRVFQDKLSAVAFDPSIEEVEKLNLAEKNSKVEYIAAFVTSAEGAGPSSPAIVNNPYPRFSGNLTVENRAARAAENALSHDDLMAQNMWGASKLADPGSAVYLPRFFSERGWSTLDFVKIDVDGSDFDLLRSIGGDLAARSTLGVMLEVNFYGGAGRDENTFANMDLFMREAGYQLCGLTVRTYSSASLPFPYLYTYPLAAQTSGGRPFQGDALYMKDVAERTLDTKTFSDTQLLKAAALLSLFNLPDYAAEVLDVHEERLRLLLDYDRVRDLLAIEVQERDADVNNGRLLKYKDYMALFDADDRSFYETLGRRESRREASASAETLLRQLQASKDDVDLQTALKEARAKIRALEDQLALTQSQLALSKSTKRNWPF